MNDAASGVNDREKEYARRIRGVEHREEWVRCLFRLRGFPARTLWMSFFFGFRSPYFALSFSSCCRITSSGEGCRGGGVEGFRSGWV